MSEKPIDTRLKPSVQVAANRCPYCRDDVQPEASVACQSCLTRHHPECWDEAGACSSCSGEARLAAPKRPPLTLSRAITVLESAGYQAAEIRGLLQADATHEQANKPTPIVSRFVVPLLLLIGATLVIALFSVLAGSFFHGKEQLVIGLTGSTAGLAVGVILMFLALIKSR